MTPAPAKLLLCFVFISDVYHLFCCDSQLGPSTKQRVDTISLLINGFAPLELKVISLNSDCFSLF